MSVKVIKPDGLPVHGNPSSLARVLVDEETGSKQVVIVLGEWAPGFVSEHTRDNEEINYILSGRVELEVPGQGTYTMTPGMLAFIPAGVKHRHENRGPEVVRMLGIRTPQGNTAKEVKSRPLVRG